MKSLFITTTEDSMSVRRAGILLSLLAFSAVSQAIDYGQYNNVQPEKNWIESLRDAYGVSCCATADGYRPQDVEWDVGNHYRVKVENRSWCVTAPLLKAQIGSATQLWLYGSLDFDGSRMVRCFLPGPTS